MSPRFNLDHPEMAKLQSRGFAPGWYEAAPSALKLMRSHTFESAKGASHISLERSPRKELQQEIKG
jgi:hypothetical protein